MNRLKNESSPYLLQHAHNPVEWYPWGEEALYVAEKENKLLFISIGYSACHWCHVMEKESFENNKVAEFLNENFISVKVDREERPDIDKSYMSAVQLMNGSGGWPLTCFATPEGKAFYGGTYFPVIQFLDILSQLAEMWRKDSEKIRIHADSIFEGVQNSELIHEKELNPDWIQMDDYYELLSRDFDNEDGGMKRVPKFLIPSIYHFLMMYGAMSKNQSALDHTLLTINKVINSGMYDQLDGGIARYSTDKKWFVPHFEKMLYDNSQFISMLSWMYTIKPSAELKEKLLESLEFTDREFRDESGAYYSSLDADSEGNEGRYYIWKYRELKEICGNYTRIIADYYGIKQEGNWIEEQNILSVRDDISLLASKYNKSTEELRNIINICKQKIRDQRKFRQKPDLDTKIITSWNALHIRALCHATHASGEKVFLDRAVETAEFIRENLISADGGIKRIMASEILGFLDDYAFTMEAFFQVYQLNFDEKWLKLTKKLLDYTIKHFYDEITSMFFYSPGNVNNPVARQSEVFDNVIPSSNSVMAENLYFASFYFNRPEYREISRQMLQNIQAHLSRSPSFFSNWARVQLLHESHSAEIVVTGNKAEQFRKGFYGKFLPGILFAGAKKKSQLYLLKDRIHKDESKIYVCENYSCKLAVEDVDKALKLIRSLQS